MQTLHEEVKGTANWALDPENNPSETLYRLGNIGGEINRIEERIAELIPQQRECRQEIKSNKDALNALNTLLEISLTSNTYEDEESIQRCAFGLFNAVRDEKHGTVKIHFS